MNDGLDFDSTFEALTGNCPFPWQNALYEQFIAGNIPPSCNLPTGLGKTRVIAIWLIALVNGAKMPRRLVYVVNRRTVVDQTTDEVEKLRANLPRLVTLPDDARQLALSTLRGQFADNREWSTDPSRPAVICGTVDMIGSRLLFSGYGVGFKTRPLHAGFLGQDTLIVHDEAHLEPAFQELLVEIRKEQERCGEFRSFRIMELSATSRGGGDVFELTKEEKDPPQVVPDPPTKPIHYVWRRLKAKKGLQFVPIPRDKVAELIGQIALRWKSSGKAILLFVRTIDDVRKVQQVLTDKKEGVPGCQVQVLTGTLRGLERDRLATEDPVFARFLPEPRVTPKEGTVYLICTSAGEVGIDISADHLVCDLTPLDSMAQRLGRVNRRGDGQAEIYVVYESDPDPKKKDDLLEKARWNTLLHLKDQLDHSTWIAERREGSPLALKQLIQGLSDKQREAAFTPKPTILPVSDILFDAWALTTIRGELPGRPPVEPYLHGKSDWEPPTTRVAWREEVGVITGDLLKTYEPKGLLDDYPVKPHELLQDRSDRVFENLVTLAVRHPDGPVWLVGNRGDVKVCSLGDLADKNKKNRINHCTLLLPPAVGGLQSGHLNGKSETADDVADELFEDADKTTRRRVRFWNDDPQRKEETKVMRRIRKPIQLEPPEDDEDAEGRFWHWFERPLGGDSDGSGAATKAVLWDTHTKDVVDNVTLIVRNLPLSNDVKQAVIFAAMVHDLGKRRGLFQRALGNSDPVKILAKSGHRSNRIPELYRHEFGSLIDAVDPEQRYLAEFKQLSDDMQDLGLHIVAVHHGYGRPHFPKDRAFDPERPQAIADSVAHEVPRRFARLQRKYGRWGLAYIESLLRAADYAASAKPTEFAKDDEEDGR